MPQNVGLSLAIKQMDLFCSDSFLFFRSVCVLKKDIAVSETFPACVLLERVQ